MTHVATFKENSTYPSQRVLFEDEDFTNFTIEGLGWMDASHLAGFDSAGELEWTSPELREWTYQRIREAARATAPSTDNLPWYASKTALAIAVSALVLVVGAAIVIVGLAVGTSVFSDEAEEARFEQDLQQIVAEERAFYQDAIDAFNDSFATDWVASFVVWGEVYASIGRAADYPDAALVTVVSPGANKAHQWVFSPDADELDVAWRGREVAPAYLDESVKQWNLDVRQDGTLALRTVP